MANLFQARVTPQLVRALERERIHLNLAKAPDRFREGDRLLAFDSTVIEPNSAIFEGSHICAFGAFSYCHVPVTLKQRIGRYCSIARDVTWMGAHHSLDRLSSSPFAYKHSYWMFALAAADAGVKIEPPPEQRPCKVARIEHDVWIGEGAYLAHNLTLGIGSVVAARSVVTRSVEPYMIVGGNPARVIRRRFSDDVVERLLASRWWDYAFTQFVGMPVEDPLRFLDAFEEARNAGRLQRIDARETFAAMVRRIAPETEIL